MIFIVFLLGAIILSSLVQIIFKRWLFTLGQIEMQDNLMKAIMWMMLFCLIISDRIDLSSKEVLFIFVAFVIAFVAHKEKNKTSQDILVDYLKDNNYGVFVMEYQDSSGRWWGKLSAGELKMTAVALHGNFKYKRPCMVSILLDLDAYGDIKEIQVVSLED